MSADKLQFDELDIKFGQLVEILPKGRGEKVFTEVLLLGIIPGESVILSVSDTGVFPETEQGETVVVRVKLADGVAIFAVTVLHISDIPLHMVYLDYPGDITFKRIRNATRVAVNLPVLATNLSEKKYSGITGRIMDISISGAGLELSEYAGKKGETLNMKGKFAVGNIKRVLAIEGTIRMAKKQSDTSFIYGIEFLEKNENDLLVLFGFIFNAMAFGKIQKIR